VSDGNGHDSSLPFLEASIEESVTEYVRVITAVKGLRLLTAAHGKRLAEIATAQSIAAQDIAQARSDLTRCLNATTSNGLMLERIEGKFDQLLVELRKAAPRG
jgi:hypothetical protein